MATKAPATKAPKSRLPEGFEPATLARSAGFYIPRKGNDLIGILKDVIETDDPFKKGQKRFYFKIEVTEGGQTAINDAETKSERIADQGEVIGVDEKGFLRVIRDMAKGQPVAIMCNGQQDKKDAKKGRNPAWMFEVGKVPF